MEIEKIFFDMDGVLADFDRGIIKLCNMTPLPLNGPKDDEYEIRMWDEIRKVGHFYAKLEIMPGAKELFDIVRNAYGERCEILTGIPKPKRNVPEAAQDKLDWIKRYLSDNVKANLVLRDEKKSFCKGAAFVLIDDMEKTIEEWNSLGGTGVLHTTPENTLKALRELGIL